MVRQCWSSNSKDSDCAASATDFDIRRLYFIIRLFQVISGVVYRDYEHKSLSKGKDADSIVELDAGYTPFRGTKGTVRIGDNQVLIIVWCPGKIKANSKSHDILGGLDLMATVSSVAGIKLPEKEGEGQPIIIDSYDISPVLLGNGSGNSWKSRASIYRYRRAISTSLENEARTDRDGPEQPANSYKGDAWQPT